MLRGVTDLFLEVPKGLNPTELDLLGSVIGDLLHDMEMEVRASLAEQLSLSPEAPANDITRQEGKLSDAQAHIRQLSHNGNLSEESLVSLLRGGQVSEFVVALSHMSDLNLITARRIL